MLLLKVLDAGELVQIVIGFIITGLLALTTWGLKQVYGLLLNKFGNLETKVDNLTRELADVKSDNANGRADLKAVRADNFRLRHRVNGLYKSFTAIDRLLYAKFNISVPVPAPEDEGNADD